MLAVWDAGEREERVYSVLFGGLGPARTMHYESVAARVHPCHCGSAVVT